MSDFHLYITALTHSSWSRENGGENNERLEFLGDAVLQMAVSQYLFEKFPELAEDKLSSLRQSLVNNLFLASVARELSLGKVIRLGKGENSSGGRNRDKLLAGTFEAVLAAVYFSEGYGGAYKVIESLVDQHIDAVLETRNPKLVFHEWAMAKFKRHPEYIVDSSKGPDHDKVYQVSVCAGGVVHGTGKGRSIRKASMSAAKEAIKRKKLG